MKRRTFVAGSAAALTMPSVVRGQATRLLRFIPQTDVPVLDPIWTPAYSTRNHAYMRFESYRPRPGRSPSGTAGPKIVHFDRVEWRVIPDSSTKAAALQNDEADWWENPDNDLLPLLHAHGGIRVEILDRSGNMACMRLNHLTPPFKNPAIRRALLKAISQRDFVIAIGGTDPAMWHVPTGLFQPGTPMASEAGLDVLEGPRDYEGARRDIEAAGYNGERTVLLAPTDFPIFKAEADICADVMRKIGLNLDYQASDWGAVVRRRVKKEPLEQGGRSVFNTFWAGSDQLNPVARAFLRAQGPETGMMGWPSSPRIEALRLQWMAADTLAARKAIAEELQRQAMIDVPYVPLGQVFTATAYRTTLAGVLKGFPTFWGVRRA